jgi:PAS domain S-box-containing protein
MRRFFERAMAKVPKMSEEQLRSLLRAFADENSKLETALDSMLDGIIVCDLDHQPIIYNKTAERMLGFAGLADPAEKPLWHSIQDRELADFFRETLASEENVLEREFDIVSGGRNRLLAASVTPLVSLGRIQGSLIHLEDITDKRRRDAQLRRAESLASLTTLAAGVAHEIKNPLGSISIRIQLIQKATKNRETIATASLEHHLGIVNEEIERLNKIVVDFLFAVRPMDVELREAELAPLVKDLADFIRPEAESAGVAVELRFAEKLPRVLLDRKYLRQAILNLAKNALAAMPDGGTLTFGLEADDNEVRLSVEDTGMGMTEEVMAKIFEPYYTTKESGTGLGLTITFKIIREHQGEINVKSKPGLGSAFTISLPVPQKERRLLPWRESETGFGAAGPGRGPGRGPRPALHGEGD